MTQQNCDYYFVKDLFFYEFANSSLSKWDSFFIWAWVALHVVYCEYLEISAWVLISAENWQCGEPGGWDLNP